MDILLATVLTMRHRIKNKPKVSETQNPKFRILGSSWPCVCVHWSYPNQIEISAIALIADVTIS